MVIAVSWSSESIVYAGSDWAVGNDGAGTVSMSTFREGRKGRSGLMACGNRLKVDVLSKQYRGF